MHSRENESTQTKTTETFFLYRVFTKQSRTQVRAHHVKKFASASLRLWEGARHIHLHCPNCHLTIGDEWEWAIFECLTDVWKPRLKPSKQMFSFDLATWYISGSQFSWCFWDLFLGKLRRPRDMWSPNQSCVSTPSRSLRLAAAATQVPYPQKTCRHVVSSWAFFGQEFISSFNRKLQKAIFLTGNPKAPPRCRLAMVARRMDALFPWQVHSKLKTKEIQSELNILNNIEYTCITR